MLNSKQIKNDERKNTCNVPNRRDRIRRFGFSEFEIYLVASLFRIRGPLSIFEFDE